MFNQCHVEDKKKTQSIDAFGNINHAISLVFSIIILFCMVRHIMIYIVLDAQMCVNIISYRDIVEIWQVVLMPLQERASSKDRN